MLLLTSAIAASLAGFAAAALRRVPAGQVHSVYRRGKPLRLLEPGTHWVLPGVDRIGHRIDLGGQLLRFQAGSRGGDADLRGTVYWQVLEPERADAVIDDAAQLIRRGALEALSTEEAVTDRRALGTRLKQALNGMLRDRGVMVTRVEFEPG